MSDARQLLGLTDFLDPLDLIMVANCHIVLGLVDIPPSRGSGLGLSLASLSLALLLKLVDDVDLVDGLPQPLKRVHRNY